MISLMVCLVACSVRHIPADELRRTILTVRKCATAKRVNAYLINPRTSQSLGFMTDVRNLADNTGIPAPDTADDITDGKIDILLSHMLRNDDRVQRFPGEGTEIVAIDTDIPPRR